VALATVVVIAGEKVAVEEMLPFLCQSMVRSLAQRANSAAELVEEHKGCAP